MGAPPSPTSSHSAPAGYYPIFLKLTGRPCLVIGAGPDCERKVHQLLAAGAQVTVIANHLPEALQQLVTEGIIQWKARDYRPGDLQGFFLAISTVLNPELNRKIHEEAGRYGVLLNAMDDADHSDFIHGSVLRRGDLVVAISSSGVSPALTVRLREQLENQLGNEYASLLELIKQIRPVVFSKISCFEDRRRIWYALVDSDVLQLLRQGRRAEAEALAYRLIEQVAKASFERRQAEVGKS